VAIIYASRLKL